MAQNRKATSIRFSDEEMKLLDKVAADRKLSKTATLVSGLHALTAKGDAAKLTDEQLLAEVRRRMK